MVITKSCNLCDVCRLESLELSVWLPVWWVKAPVQAIFVLYCAHRPSNVYRKLRLWSQKKKLYLRHPFSFSWMWFLQILSFKNQSDNCALFYNENKAMMSFKRKFEETNVCKRNLDVSESSWQKRILLVVWYFSFSFETIKYVFAVPLIKRFYR